MKIAIRKTHLLICLFFMLLACAEDPQNRARDPWVFRINLDDHARTIVLALNENLWAAYDPQKGGLYKVWNGGVRFRGPAFDHVHGVQPQSLGEGFAIDPLSEPQWLLIKDGNRQPLIPDYLGYHLKGDEATLRYQIPLEDGEVIILEETPEYVSGPDGAPGLRRSIRTANVPANTTVALRLHLDHLISSDNLNTDGALIDVQSDQNEFDWGSSIRTEAVLQLNSNAETVVSAFFEPKAVGSQETVTDYASKRKLPGAVPETVMERADLSPQAQRGYQLLEQNDCAACHAVNRPHIGPSYVDIANKYENSQENISTLAKRVIEGSSGVWGVRIMSAHPQLAKEDAEALVSYILSITPDQAVQRKPGIVANYYNIGLHMFNMPEVVPGQSPNLSTVVPNINFESGNPDLEENDDSVFSNFRNLFAMELNGYLNIEEPGNYQFALDANNGGQLFINDKLVTSSEFADHDWNTGKISLGADSHRIKVTYFQDLGSKSLILHWRKNENEEFKVIPASAFTHNPNDIEPSSPGVKQIYRETAPGFGATLEEMHPSFDLMPLRPEGFEPRVGGIDFLSDDRMVLCTWDGDVFILDGVTSGDPAQVTYEKFASGLAEPLGIAVVDNDDIYVIQRWELTQLLDHDGDGAADEYRVVCDDWTTTGDFHEWSYGLAYRDGYFYANLGIAQGRFYQKQASDRGTTIKIHKDGSYEFIGFGLRAHNGIGFGTDGILLATDNEGGWVPANKIVHLPLDEKNFYGNRAVIGDSLPDLKQKLPVIWLTPYEIGNSPSEPTTLNIGPYQNQTIHGDVTHGGIKRNFIEKVRGQYQGVVFRFAHGFEAGVQRINWGPDGALYVGGLGSAQDYGYREQQTGLERMVYNGKPTFEMLAIRSRSNGFEIEFTEPLRVGDGTHAADYFIQQHGFDPRGWEEIGKIDLENLTVRSVTVSDDRKKIFLEIPGLKEEKLVYFQLQPTFISETGRQIWSNEAWYTLNRISDIPGEVKPYPHMAADNSLSPDEKNAGWHLHFNEEGGIRWQISGEESASEVSVQKGLLHIPAGRAITNWFQFRDFELELEWKISRGGEAGLYQCVKTAPWTSDIPLTFPRMQLVDDKDHPDAQITNKRLSGANYDLIAPKYKITKPAGEFNHARLVVKNGIVSHWINGLKLVEYELASDELQALLPGSIYDGQSAYGKHLDGTITLQCNTGEISIKNFRIRAINADK